MKRHYRLIIGTIVLIALLAACRAPGAAPATEVQPEESAAEQAPQEPAEGPAEEPAPEAAAPTANLTEGCVDNYAEGVDYFPEKASIDYAAGFDIEYFDNYKVVTVTRPWPGADRTFEYVLVQCGTPAPQDVGDALVIEVPVTTIVPMSSTQLPHLEDLGLLDHIVGINQLAFIYNPTVRQMVESGQVAELTNAAMEVNVEVALDLNPSLIMDFSSGAPEFDTFPALIDAGLPVVINGDWAEDTTLGRAEWIKFMAVFYNVEARADEVFAGIVSQYEEAAQLARSATERPTVFTSSPFQGTWYMPGGGSYVAELLSDAGADYVFSDDDSVGSLFLDFETVFERAQDADMWINVDFASLEEMAGTDERFTEFAAFQNGQVYAFNRRVSEQGGNDYYESSAARPHLILLDLVKIFHPDLIPDHDFVYYRQLE
jgi:iron complex transport system substrate-binding protein